MVVLGLLGAGVAIIFSLKEEDRFSDWQVSVVPETVYRILYVDSYHADYPWSAGILRGIQSVLGSDPQVELRVFRMDTKRFPGESYKRASAQSAFEQIERWKPDLVIASDDNASKYLVVPYLKNQEIPVVFCGVNWDASVYGFPCSNVTGMVEVQLVDQILSTMRPYARGDRVAFLKGADLSSRKEADRMEHHFGFQLERRFVSSYAEWEAVYGALQDEADMVLLGNIASIPDWDAEKAARVVASSTRVPTGNWDKWMADYSLITIATVPEEQGAWSARAALEILAGASPGSIPVAQNKRAQLYLNMRLAKALNIRLPMALLKNAHLLSAEKSTALDADSSHRRNELCDDEGHADEEKDE